MRIIEIEEFQNGDKVKLSEFVNIEWFKKHCPKVIDTIMIVKYQDGDSVWTDKGIFDFCCLELVED